MSPRNTTTDQKHKIAELEARIGTLQNDLQLARKIAASNGRRRRRADDKLRRIERTLASFQSSLEKVTHIAVIINEPEPEDDR